MKRAHIGLKTKLAAALLHMKRYHLGRWENIITHEEAKTLTADEIIARFHFDHFPIPHAEGGTDHPSNLDPVLIADHQEKTAKIDVPGIAKRKRVSKAHEEFQRRMLVPRADRELKKSKWAKRPFQQRRKPK